jgi:hypothetical protein
MSTVSMAPASSSRRLRRWRRRLDPCVSVLGILVILGAVLFSQELRTQILVTTCGIVLMEVGVWRLAQRLLPSERQYKALRAEVDRFLQLVRHLNTAALARKAHDAPQTHQAFAQVYQEMQQAVARMATLAGKTDAELAAEKAQEPLRRAV